MDWLPRVRQQLPLITGDAERDRDIQQELADHLADREAELLGGGVPPALVQARVTRELMIAARKRRRLGRPPMRLFSDLAHDLRYAARLLARTPGFTVAAVATLALAIGATTALFSVVQAILLRPLPLPDPDRLVYIWEVSPQGETRNEVAAGNYFDWRERAASFESMGAMNGMSRYALTGSGQPTTIEGIPLTDGALAALRVAPLHGRAFAAEDTILGAPSVVILTHGFWMRHFGGHPSVIGQTLSLDERPFTIVGVMPREFEFQSPDLDVLTALRFGPDERHERRSHNVRVLARLRPGVSIATADAEMDALAAAMAADHPQHLTGWSTNVAGVHADAVREIQPLLTVLSGVVLAVLLIACANLANLQLARADRRLREMAVRAAIGAGRARMVRQMLTEALLLAAIGGAIGVGLAAASVRAIVAAAPADIPYLERVGIDWTVLLAAAAMSVVSAVSIGTAPALRVARTDVRALLHGGRVPGHPRQQRLRQALVVIQVAVALVLVASAALLARTFVRLNGVSTGYDPRGVLTVSIDLPRVRYPDLPAQLGFYDRLFERLNAQASVAGAAGTTAMPGEGTGMTFSFAIEGRPSSNPSGREHPVPLHGITAEYFDAMRIPVIRGRSFGPTDRGDAPPVVIINESLARRHWPNGDAVGSRINFRPGQMPWREIVGIVGDTRDGGIAEAPSPTIYVPFSQRASNWAWMSWQTLVVRARSAGAESLVEDVKTTLWSIDPNLPLLDVATVEDRLAEGESRRRLAGTVLMAFAALALLLSTIGVYGVMACSVAEQRHDIGIRLALGAVPAAVARRIVFTGLALASIGVGAGVAVALPATKYLGTLLYEVQATDPVAFGATTALLLAVAVAAAWLPARRAMRVDPLEVLRQS